MLAVYLIPLINANGIFLFLYNVYTLRCNSFSIILLIVSIVGWLFSIFIAIMAISAIDDPRDHITNADDCSGIFFSSGLYKHISFLDSICNRNVVTASKDIHTFIKSIPTSEEDILKEYSFEFMKLVYIREIKFLRLKWCLSFASASGIAGFVLYLLYYPL